MWDSPVTWGSRWWWATIHWEFLVCNWGNISYHRVSGSASTPAPKPTRLRPDPGMSWPWTKNIGPIPNEHNLCICSECFHIVHLFSQSVVSDIYWEFLIFAHWSMRAPKRFQSSQELLKVWKMIVIIALVAFPKYLQQDSAPQVKFCSCLCVCDFFGREQVNIE